MFGGPSGPEQQLQRHRRSVSKMSSLIQDRKGLGSEKKITLGNWSENLLLLLLFLLHLLVSSVSPLNFLPTVTTTVDNVGRIQVTVDCLCQATPTPVMSWTRGTEVITNGTNSHISDDGLRLQIRSYNVSDLLQQTYTCSCRNPLGSQKREVQLLGNLNV